MAMAAKKYADDYDTVVTADEKGRERKKAVYHGEYMKFLWMKNKSLPSRGTAYY